VRSVPSYDAKSAGIAPCITAGRLKLFVFFEALEF
jgi:hypothetical protein